MREVAQRQHGAETSALAAECNRHLLQVGCALVEVPLQYGEWDRVCIDEALDEYLRGELDASCGGAPAAASRCRIAPADEPGAASAARKDRKI